MQEQNVLWNALDLKLHDTLLNTLLTIILNEFKQHWIQNNTD